MEFIKEKPYMAVIIALVASVVGTHFADASYYQHRMDKEGDYSFTRETDMGLDFNSLIEQTQGKLDCSQFKFQPNVSSCQFINDLRK